jgi:hypothetical protein
MKKAVLREYLKVRENKPVITPYDAEADIFEDMEEMKRRLEETKRRFEEKIKTTKKAKKVKKGE